MPDTDTLTYLQTPPRRPVIDDLHGALLENVPGKTPGPDHPNALAMNQSDKLVALAHELIDVARIYVTNNGTVTVAAAWPSWLSTSDFTKSRTGAGDVSIFQATGKLPAATWPAIAVPVGNVGDCTINVEVIVNGWRVRSRVGGAATDVNFLLNVSGLG